MIITNKQIYESNHKLFVFLNSDFKMPVRINFYLQKNIQIVAQAAEEIEKARLSIAAQHGIANEEKTGYIVPEDKISLVAQELNDLFNLEQDLNIHIFKLSDFDGIELTFQELSAIMFMVEED